MPKNAVFFSCDVCNFKCSKESNYNVHLSTLKHKKFTSVYKENAVTENAHKCDCLKTYTTRMGLWKHKQKCQLMNDKSNTALALELKEMASRDKDGLILKLLKDNEEIKKILREVLPKIGNNTIINNNNNNTTNNNTMHNNFNLNVFLNEQCKDALNISDFIDSLKITLEDLLFSKTNGISRGITDVMIKGLKELDINKRPIHCTDIKRDIMYIKDEDKWQKDENHEMMKNTIVKIADKERTALQKWAIDNPDWIETERKQIEYLTMMRSICEPIENYTNYERKIIKNIGKEILIDKK
jgi:hypothetical protein